MTDSTYMPYIRLNARRWLAQGLGAIPSEEYLLERFNRIPADYRRTKSFRLFCEDFDTAITYSEKYPALDWAIFHASRERADTLPRPERYAEGRFGVAGISSVPRYR